MTPFKKLEAKPLFDAGDSVFVMRQMEQFVGSMETPLETLKARLLFPEDNSGDPVASQATYEIWEQEGICKLISDYSADLPRVDAKVREESYRWFDFGNAAGFSKREIEAAQKFGRNLDARKRSAALRAWEQLVHSLAFNGDADLKIPGLLTNPNISTMSAPNNAGATSTLWVNKTADEILADMNALCNSIPEDTNGIEVPDTLLLPLAQFHLVNTKRIGSDSSMTVLKFFMETNSYIKNVDWCNDLKTAAVGGGPLAVAYRRSPEVMGLQIPQELTPMAPQQKNMELVINFVGTCGGLVIYRPLAIKFMDLI